MTIVLSFPLLIGIGAAIVALYVQTAALFSSTGQSPALGLLGTILIQLVLFLLAYGFVSFCESF